MTKNLSASRRLAIFLAGVPGYILTLLPWMFVLTLLSMIIVRYTADGDINFDYLKLQYESYVTSPSQIVFLGLISFGLWIFMAWFIKHALLRISKKFGDSEKVWQTTKIAALVSGWAAVGLAAIFVFENLTRGFVISEILVTSIGLASIGLEYLLTRLWSRRA